MNTPTTQQVATNIQSQISAAISQSVPLLPKSFSNVIAVVLSGVFIILYKYCGFIFLQMFVAHATWDETEINGRKVRPLVEWGRLVGAGDPIDATRAELVVRVTVTNQVGTLAAGSQLLRADTQVLYQTVSAVALNAATVDVTVRASSDREGLGGVGVVGNLQPGDIIQFANPLPNVVRDVAVISQSVTGADAESLEAYRARVVRRFQRKPQGGAYADYQAWGESVPGIANVYPYTGLPGQVNLYIEAVATVSSPDGIPTTPQKDAVENAVNFDVSGLASNRPANAFVNYLPIARTAYDLVVVGLSDDAAKPAIESAVDEYLRTREPFIDGLSVLPRLDRVATSAVGGIVEDVVNSMGFTVSSAYLQQFGVPIVATTLGAGEKAKLGTPSYI